MTLLCNNKDKTISKNKEGVCCETHPLFPQTDDLTVVCFFMVYS